MAKTIYSAEYRHLIDALRERREAAGLSQSEVAKALGWPQQRVSLTEAGARRLDVIEFLRWANVIGLTTRRAWSLVENAMASRADAGA